MVKSTDIGIIPKDFPISLNNSSVYKAREEKIFSDELLNYIKRNIK